MERQGNKGTLKLTSGELLAIILIFIGILVFLQIITGTGIFERSCSVSVSPSSAAPNTPFLVLLTSNIPITGKIDTIDYVVYGINPWINNTAF